MAKKKEKSHNRQASGAELTTTNKSKKNSKEIVEVASGAGAVKELQGELHIIYFSVIRFDEFHTQ
ncbi:hypothetical protein PHJA_002915200 [Phtheirospermum japonicum]|uniref:Uncharacterized protein n=1 Tax=Phtheirospermum japonicum TaxID=374723 RepID=A0A830DPV3_9LAMI|nr:hypothetical protein PHJA_002915200 [Phtheirospermum japonicum]